MNSTITLIVFISATTLHHIYQSIRMLCLLTATHRAGIISETSYLTTPTSVIPKSVHSKTQLYAMGVYSDLYEVSKTIHKAIAVVFLLPDLQFIIRIGLEN
jgi:hypothetical protein